MKKVCLLFFILAVPQFILGEAIFLKNGEIIEAVVEKETDDSVAVKMPNGFLTTIPREQILRILFVFDYKDKVNIYLHNGDVIECHIVEEDSTSYTYRENLDNNQEAQVLKTDVRLITVEKLNQLKLGMKIQAGSGALGFAGITFEFYGIELYLSGGFLYLPAKGEDKEAYGVPIKLQVSYTFFNLGSFAPYVFGSGIYGLSLKNYNSKFCTGGGVGLTAFKYFFAEAGYYTVFKDNGFAFGLGIKIPFKIF